MSKRYLNKLKVSIILHKESRGRVRTASLLRRLPLHVQSLCKLPGWSVAPCSWRVSQYPQPKWPWVVLWRWEANNLLHDSIASPDVITEFLSCRCSSDCKFPNCQWLANGLKCTITCKMQDCNNWQESNSADQDCDSEDSSDAEDKLVV